MNYVSHIFGRFANRLLHQLGYELIKRSSSMSWRSAFARLQRQGIKVATVIDVGASNGKWSRDAKLFYSDAFFLLIEAQPVHELSLRAYKDRNINVEYVLAAAGDIVGETYFDANDPFGGLALKKPSDKPTIIKTPMTTVDVEVNTRKLPRPYLIKLDTHGFEVPILQGARETLKHTAIICVETYNFITCEECLRFPDMCRFLEERGFLPIGLCNPLFRPRDEVLWQMDLIFARSDRKEFLSNTYL